MANAWKMSALLAMNSDRMTCSHKAAIVIVMNTIT